MTSGELFFIESLGELLEAVQLQKIFPDAKYFVDCTPRTDVAAIMEEFRKRQHEPGFDLNLFVNTHFILPADLPSDYLSANKPLLQHIEDLWTVLKRTPVVQSGTLISLPHSYIVPGGRFREVFYWDSYFTMLGLQVSGHIDLIECMINNFAYLANRFGRIPNGNRTYFLSRSQPPFFSLMIEILAEEKGTDIWMQYLPALEKEYAFWMDGVTACTPLQPAHRRVVRLPDGYVLNRYWDDKDIVRPEAYYEESRLAHRSGRPVHEVYRHLRAACESGWDYSCRWLGDGQHWETIEAADIIPVDLNCLLLHLEETLLKIYSYRQDTEKIKMLQSATQARYTAIQQYCWNETHGFYFDYHHTRKRQTGQYSLAAVYPLFFKIAGAAQAQQVANTIEKRFLGEGGLVTTLTRTGQQWDAPNGWAPLQWLAWKGLQHYGFAELATKIKERWLKTCEKVYAETGKMMEKYDVMDISAKAGGGKYPNQDGFGWTNGVYLKLLNS